MNARVLILAPRGRDSEVAADLLYRAGFQAHVCVDQSILVAELIAGAGAVLLTEEALAPGLPALVAWVAAQDAWSDIPFIVLGNGSRSPRTNAAADRLGELGNVVMLERPLHAEALLGAVRSALKARARQFEARDADARLRDSEERLRLAVENAEVGFWDVDLVNDRLIWPPRTKAMFGISPDVTVALSDFFDGLHPEDRARTTEAYLAAADPQLRALYDVEYRVIGREDGVQRWVAAKGRGVFSENGRCLRVTGTALDITRRKQADGRRNAVGELGQVLKDAHDPREIAGAAAAVLGRAINTPLVRYAEVDDDAETFTVVGEWRRPGMRSRGRALRLRDYGSFMARLDQGEPIVVSDVRTDPRAGSAAATLEGEGARAFVVAPVLERGRLAALLFVDQHEPRTWAEADLALIREFADRTRTAVERVQGELALRESETRLRQLNETLETQVELRSAERDRLWNLSQDMLARADYSGMISAVSPAWTRVLGWRESELLSRGYASFMHPEDAPPTLEAIARMAEDREPTRFENRIATRDGGWKPIEWTVAPEADGVNFIAVGRDLSHARAREAELEKAQEALRQSQKMEAMGQLTGGVAHDFNNLLTPIVGSLDLLQRRGLGGEREQRLIEGAVQSADRARTLVQRLLAFARRQPLQSVGVNIAQLVLGMGDLIESTTGPHIRVVVDAGEDLPPAKADPNQLEMALLNLAVNARDAMPDGGELRLIAQLEIVDGEHRSGLPEGDYILISVADSGFGMDEATMARAIEPFFSTKGIGKGTGLGLSMVHGLASQLGGALTLRSSRGEGTTVELWLPVTYDVAQASTKAQPETGAGFHRGVALLVDDEDLVRASTADMLADLGYDVVEAGSGEAAAKMVAQGQTVDLVVTDHLMPGMNGVELARRLQAVRPALPVLLVSGYADIEGVDASLPRLTKPFRKAELAARLVALQAKL